ncbi:Replication protein A 70 kDa DNA-binding subunit C [Linum grandiflorum]
MVDLTESAISLITGGTSMVDLQPILQVTELKQVHAKLQPQPQPQAQPTERFKLVLSDGSHLQQAMLGTQINDLVKDNKLRAGSVIKLVKFTCTTVQHRMIVIILELIIILEECGLIGHPVSLRPSRPFPLSTDQPMNAYASPQLSGGSTFTGRVVSNSDSDQPMNVYSNLQPSGGSNFAGRVGTNLDPAAASVQSLRVNQPDSGFQSMGYDAGRHVKTTVPSFGMKSESGVKPLGSSMSAVPLSNQAPGFNHLKREGARASSGSYSNMSRSTYQQPPAMYSNRGPVARNEAPAAILPISALNPYQGRWTIKARVTAKAEMRHYHNPRGEGKVFSFDLLDSNGGEIRVTCFNAVADQFYPCIEVGRVYTVSKGSLKPAQKNFNHLNNDLEIFLENGSIVQQCDDDDSSIPRQQFHFRMISEIEGLESGSIVDLIGIVYAIIPATSIMKKNGTETQKRSLQLKDMSYRSVELTLWGNFCNAEGHELQKKCDSGNFPILAIKSGRINDFNGKAVGTISTSQLFIDPEFEEAGSLKQWFEREGRNASFVSISKQVSSGGRNDVLKTISQIKDESLGMSGNGKPDWISVNAAVIFVKSDSFMYTACPIMIGDRPCNKKVSNNGDGKWRCEKCDQTVDECEYRYILQVQIQDHTGSTWATAFQESAELLMGMPAKDLYFMKFEQQDDEGFMKVLRKVLFTRYVFKLKILEETYNDEARVKSTVVKIEKVNCVSHSKALLELMGKGESGNLGSSLPIPESGHSNIASSTTGMGNIGSGQTGLGHMGSHQVGEYSNQYNSRFSTLLESGGPMSCNSCGATSHSSMNCPSIMAGSQQLIGGDYMNRTSNGADASSGRGGECFKCHQSGHWAKDCPVQSYGNRYGGSSNHNR